MCVVCVYSYSIKLFTSRGKAAQNLSICSIHPALNSERKEKDTGYRTCHASAASGVISAKIRTSVHPPKYADQGHAPGHDAHSHCAPDNSESTAHNRAHQGQVPGHSTGKYTGSPR